MMILLRMYVSWVRGLVEGKGLGRYEMMIYYECPFLHLMMV